MVCSEYSWLRGHRSVLCTSLLQSIAYLRQSPFAVAFPSKSPSVLWENPQDSSPAPQFQVLYWFANIKKLQTLWSAVNILGCGDISPHFVCSFLQSLAYIRQAPFAVAFPSKSPSALWGNPHDFSPAPQVQVRMVFWGIKKNRLFRRL